MIWGRKVGEAVAARVGIPLRSVEVFDLSHAVRAAWLRACRWASSRE